jgi:hypothetical protein
MAIAAVVPMAAAPIASIVMHAIRCVPILPRLQTLAGSDGLLSVGCAVALGKHSEGIQNWPVACAAAARNIPCVSD